LGRELKVQSLITAESQYRAWMIAALAGDGESYRQLLVALTGHLRAYFLRRTDSATAEDLVQETLIGLHLKRATYDPEQPFTAWVHGIARYKMIDEFRRTKRRATVPLDDADGFFASENADAGIAKRDIERLLKKLPSSKRYLVQAVKLDGHSIAEVAAASGMSEATVKVTVHRAVKSLSDDVERDRDAH
jgi:RNA polymerase sigma-70 factor (ECF subfamily)